MKKAVVIYWSGTGNTELMAEAVAEGAKAAGTEVSLLTAAEAVLEHVAGADYVALGCPSMGDEVLEESEMEPFVASLQGVVKDKPLALFGSYGWGDGAWMADWSDRMKQYGAKLIASGLIINERPNEDGLTSCKELGKTLCQD